ncbi:interleukin-15 [Hoplias malabaricus]|uniref:interleukin-15 n=1 Tax=Hoplias malabaricus TaxID=27720 RepID=UPI003462CB9A
MTIFLTLYLILVLGIWSKPRKHRSKGTVRCICLLWCFDSNLEYHLNIEVWNSFLILSYLSVFLTTVDATDSRFIELRNVLKQKHIFERSDAMLYTPNPDTDACLSKMMYCYLLELLVIATEEDDCPKDCHAQTVYSHKNLYFNCSHSEQQCPECESYPLMNATEFSKSMEKFLQRMSSTGKLNC